MYCLAADVAIRTATGNRFGLIHGLREVLKRGGHTGEWWNMRQLNQACDAATGTDVLSRLYAKHRNQGVRVPLDDLFDKLGVRVAPNGLRLDDSAPQSDIRRAITVPL